MNDMDRRHKKLRTLIFEDRKVKVQFYKLLCKSNNLCVICYVILHCIVQFIGKRCFGKIIKCLQSCKRTKEGCTD